MDDLSEASTELLRECLGTLRGDDVEGPMPSGVERLANAACLVLSDMILHELAARKAKGKKGELKPR